jgi:hypothetical protein
MRFLLAALVALPAAAQDLPPELNDFPTDARAEYVFTCMAVNGQNQDMLRRCSCSIDAVSSIVPYDTYEKASTILQMRQVTGDATAVFRGMTMLDEIVKQLRLAQIEADFRCF